MYNQPFASTKNLVQLNIYIPVLIESIQIEKTFCYQKVAVEVH